MINYIDPIEEGDDERVRKLECFKAFGAGIKYTNSYIDTGVLDDDTFERFYKELKDKRKSVKS